MSQAMKVFCPKCHGVWWVTDPSTVGATCQVNRCDGVLIAHDLTAEREAHAATRRELEALRERVAATLEVLAGHGRGCEHDRSECGDGCVWYLGRRVEEALTKGAKR